MRDYFTVGRITGAHGIKGEVKVLPLTDNVRRFYKLKNCYLLKGENDFPDESDSSHELSSVRLDRGSVLVRFDDIIDRTEAEKLRGLYLVINRNDAIKPDSGKYFIADLIGCTVFDDTHGEVGKISDVLDYPSGSILSIVNSEKKDILIPFRKEFFYSVNIDESSLYCRLPEGLLEIYL